MNNLRKAFAAKKIMAVMFLISGFSFAESFTGWSPEIRADTRTVAVENLRIGFESNHRIAIRYDLVAAFGNATVTISVSTDGGGSYQNLAATDFDDGAAMGSGVLAGSEKLARWCTDQTFPDNQYANVRIKVAAQSSTRSHHQVSSIFSIDTRLLQNLTLESIGVTPSPLAGRNHVFPVNVTAMQKPDVSVKLRITENSLPVSVSMIDPSDWTLAGDRWRAEIMVGWQPQALECRDTVLMATIDPSWENVVEETDENDNSRDAVVRLRVRERLGTANGNTVYGDVLDRAAFDQAMSRQGRNLAATLAAGSVEVENGVGGRVRDARRIVETLTELVANIDTQQQTRFFAGLSDRMLPTMYDSTLLWGATDPLGNIANLLLPNPQQRADARKMVLLSAVLQQSSEYDWVHLLSDFVPTLIGSYFVLNDISDLTGNNVNVFKRVADSTGYREYLRFSFSTSPAGIASDIVNTPTVANAISEIAGTMGQHNSVFETTAKKLLENILQDTLETLIQDWSGALVAAGLDVPDRVSLDEAYRWRASQTLAAAEKLRVFRAALFELRPRVSGDRRADVDNWIIASAAAIDELSERYRQYTVVIDPATNPDEFAEMANETFGLIQNIAMQMGYTLGQSAIKSSTKLVLKGVSQRVATKIGNQALASAIGAIPGSVLVGLEAGRLLTNQDALDRCRSDIIMAGRLIRDYLDEFWYMTFATPSIGGNVSACLVLQSLRLDMDAYTYDQAAMFVESGFYGLTHVFMGDDIASIRNNAQTRWDLSQLVWRIQLSRERLFHDLLASCADYNRATDKIDHTLPTRTMNLLSSVHVSNHAGGWMLWFAQVDVESRHYSESGMYEDGKRRLVLRPSWSGIDSATLRFSSRMDMRVEQHAQNGVLLASSEEPSDGGILRMANVRDKFFWDAWVLPLEPETHTVRLFVRGYEWLSSPPASWAEVAVIDCSLGAAPMSSTTVSLGESAHIPTGAPEPLDENVPAITVTNAVPIDTDDNGLSDSVCLEGHYVALDIPSPHYLGVIAATESNVWHSLFGPYTLEGDGTEPEPFSIDLAGRYVASGVVTRASLLDAALIDVATAEPEIVDLAEMAPSNGAPRFVASVFEYETLAAGAGHCHLTWSAIAERTDADTGIQVLTQVVDTNGAVTVASQAGWLNSTEPATFSQTLETVAEPDSVRLWLLDERQVVVDVRNVPRRVERDTRIDAVIPQAAEDVTGDGIADRIPVRILLTGEIDGPGSLFLTCKEDSGRTIHEQTFLVSKSAPGDEWVNVNLSVEPLTFSGIVPPWRLDSVRWFADDGAFLAVSSEDVILETPSGALRPSVRFTGSNVCSVVAGADGMPELLRVVLGIEVDQTGTLHASSSLDSVTSNRIGRATVSGQAVEAGESALVFNFPLSSLATPVPGGPYRIHTIEVWRDGVGRIGTFLDGFEVGHPIEAEDLIRPAYGLSDPVDFQWLDSTGDGFDDRIAVSIAASIPESLPLDLELLCVGGAVTNTLRLQDVNVSTGQTVIATQFPAIDLLETFAATGQVTFERARLCSGATLLAEHTFSRMLEAEGPIGGPAMVDAIEVVSWTPLRDEPEGLIETLEVEMRWNCSGPTPLDATLSLAPLGSASGWALQESVAAVSGLNSATFSYPGWMFWYAGVSNAIVSRRFEARDPDGHLLGAAENFATSVVWNASAFASIDLPDLAFGDVTILPLVDQSGVPPDEEKVRLQAVVCNVGTARAEAFAGAAETTSLDGRFDLSHASVPALSAGSQWLWEMDVIRPRGEHALRLELDPDKHVMDRNRSQNVHAATLLIPLDTDGDGLPDLWEYRYFDGFQATHPDVDADGDGAPNWHEYRAGTDPTDPACVFAVKRLLVHEMKWNAIPGKVYRVWWTDSLDQWPSDQSLLVGETDTWTPPSSDAPVRFFRVTIEE